MVNEMATTLPALQALEIHDANMAERWKTFCLAWTNYVLATKLGSKPESVQVATLLTVIGEEERDMFLTLGDWATAGDEAQNKQVLQKFADYYQPKLNVPFERCFNT